MIALGIDPGLTGAMSAICARRGLLDVADLPTCSNGLETGKMLRWIDPKGLADIFAYWADRHEFGKESVVAFIERPIAMPGQQISTAASNFDSLGALRASVALRGYDLNLVTPNEWKRFYGLSTKKGESLEKARVLYPAAPIKLAKHHNRAESILIARYGLRTML